MKYTVLGISSGGGVSLYPFKKNLIGNIETRAIFHTAKDLQWKLNFGEIPLYKSPVLAYNAIGNRMVNVVISSPDCGSGSILRMSRAKEYGNHKENKSLALFFEGVGRYKPQFFYFENLEGLFKSFPEEDFDALLPGYRLIKHLAPVSMWGNSQINRERLIIIGIRDDLHPRVDQKFALPDMRLNNRTCFELYGDLDNTTNVELAHVREPKSELITIYAGKKMTIGAIKEAWKNELSGKKRWEVTDRKFKNAPGVYRNRKNDYPATARKANRQFDHYGNMLTPRQLARIQGVPDQFRIYIDPAKLNYWINKGRALVTKTPPFEIGQWFKNQVEKLDLWP